MTLLLLHKNTTAALWAMVTMGIAPIKVLHDNNNKILTTKAFIAPFANGSMMGFPGGQHTTRMYKTQAAQPAATGFIHQHGILLLSYEIHREGKKKKKKKKIAARLAPRAGSKPPAAKPAVLSTVMSFACDEESSAAWPLSYRGHRRCVTRAG